MSLLRSSSSSHCMSCLSASHMFLKFSEPSVHKIKLFGWKWLLRVYWQFKKTICHSDPSLVIFITALICSVLLMVYTAQGSQPNKNEELCEREVWCRYPTIKNSYWNKRVNLWLSTSLWLAEQNFSLEVLKYWKHQYDYSYVYNPFSISYP